LPTRSTYSARLGLRSGSASSAWQTAATLGIALGWIGDRLPSPLGEVTPLVDAGRVALLGPRDATAIDEAARPRSGRTSAAFSTTASSAPAERTSRWPPPSTRSAASGGIPFGHVRRPA
jgi:hypothetical protein